nr:MULTISPECIES: IclR family transcriptional regulator C-terminal domain-containing protein [unclassified Alteromonas]
MQKTNVGTDYEEFIDGMAVVSVPVVDSHGRLFACLFCNVPVIRKNLDKLLHFIPELRAVAVDIGNLAEEVD